MTCKRDIKPVARFVPGFAGWTEFTASIPKIYWDVKSQEQRILGICKMLDKICCYADMLGDKININREDIDELTDMFNQFMESGFDEYYEEQIHQWVLDNMPEIIADAIRMVFFGLTDDGYFCAYIPQPWYDVIFDTGAVYGSDDYGCLILRY